MDNGILVLEAGQTAEAIRALNSDLRREILRLVYDHEMNINQIARQLGIPQSTCAVNVQILEKAGLLRTEQRPATKGLQKVCHTTCHQVVLTLHDQELRSGRNTLVREMPVGLFFDYNVKPSCGLASRENIIGFNDQPESFLDPHRATAALVWFADGFIEYRFPFENHVYPKLTAISISAELCSEFPQHNNNWPSEITLWINGEDAGTWLSPGDMGDRRGHFTPPWWDDYNSQYGYLKTWRITRDGCTIDGVSAKNTSARIDKLSLEHAGYVVVRFGIKHTAEFRGGINLFGRGFGNYDQDIKLTLELED